MLKPIVEVAIGLVFSHTKVLVGWREAKQHQGNKHEFPGGKVEQGETAKAACRREVLEEVGVDIATWHLFECIEHDYDDVFVRLHVFFGNLEQNQHKKIQQPWQWYAREELTSLNFPKANAPLLARLQWQKLIKISDDLSDIHTLDQTRLLYFRPQQWGEQEAEAVRSLTTVQQQMLILNEQDYLKLDMPELKCAAIHLKQSQLMQKQQGSLIVGQRYIAACHDFTSLKHAQFIGCEAMFLSPVLDTPSHPNATSLGWQQAEHLIKDNDIAVPVYALGGIQPSELNHAQNIGFYGVAGISQF